MRRTYKAVVEVTAEVHPASRYKSTDLADDIRDMVALAINEEIPVEVVVWTVTGEE